jgi:phosphoribosylanthranilate isomerase
MADVKICGIRTTDDLTAAHAAGARWTGFVFYPKSPRHLTLDEAAGLREHLLGLEEPPLSVALVVDAGDDELGGIADALRPEMIQCHGSETPERIREIKSRFNTGVMKAVRIADARALKAAEAYDGAADMILFDSAPPEAELPGGTGHRFDWELMRSYEGQVPWMLAGGLTPDNVAEAIRISGAKAVDVSSGVENSPGNKDHEAIHRFVSASL